MDVSVYTVRLSACVNGTIFTRLIAFSFGRRERQKYWWCGSILLPLLLHFYISRWYFMTWVDGNNYICTGNVQRRGKSEISRGENTFFHRPWSILLGRSSMRGMGSCLASDSSLKPASILTFGADVAFIGVSRESTEGESTFVI